MQLFLIFLVTATLFKDFRLNSKSSTIKKKESSFNLKYTILKRLNNLVPVEARKVEYNRQLDALVEDVKDVVSAGHSDSVKLIQRQIKELEALEKNLETIDFQITSAILRPLVLAEAVAKKNIVSKQFEIDSIKYNKERVIEEDVVEEQDVGADH